MLYKVVILGTDWCMRGSLDWCQEIADELRYLGQPVMLEECQQPEAMV